jgi:FkbM family methyltransferase
MAVPHYKISYAQNFEDLILSGILKSIDKGFYVDVGANHPEQDSVTKIFYDKGWRGINIEPNQLLHTLLCTERAEDVNLKVGLSSQAGRLNFRSYATLDGLSTFSMESKDSVGETWPVAAFNDSEVEVRTLLGVLHEHRNNGDIHFLKVDVEGLELEVLLGNDWGRFRPWILCMERNQNAARKVACVAFLDHWRYKAVFFDGINDYFVADEHKEIWDNFSYAGDVIMNGVVVNHIFVKCISELNKS